MEFKSNPDYETLKLIVLIAAGLITILLAIVGYFMKRQINIQETLINAVAQLTGSVKTMTALDNDRYPNTVKRLDSHAQAIKGLEEGFIKMKSRCEIIHPITKT